MLVSETDTRWQTSQLFLVTKELEVSIPCLLEFQTWSDPDRNENGTKIGNSTLGAIVKV